MMIAAIALLVAVAGVRAADGDSYEIKVYPCARADAPPVIDGDLGDTAWASAPVVDEFTVYGKPDLADIQTHFRVIYTDSDLLLGIRFDEPNMDKLTPVGQPRDSMGVFHGETIEIFVDPDHDQQDYFQFAVNAAESIYDSRKTDPSWSADVRAGVQLADDHWTMEVALPWADLGVAPEKGALLGLNVCRDRYLGANKSWTNWARTSGGWHDPERFGHIVLSPSATRIGELNEELHKGGRAGPVVIYGPEAFVRAASRSIAMTAIGSAEELLARLEETRRGEADPAAREELGRRIESYRQELADFEATAMSDDRVTPEQWREMNHRIAQIRDELRTVIWQARLSALLSEI